jgi:hypothetical protein
MGGRMKPEDVRKEHKDLIADPAIMARAIDHFSTRMDELFSKAQYHHGIYVEYETEYQKARAKRQLEYERQGIAVTCATQKAKADYAEDAGTVASARYVSGFYRNLLKRLTDRKWD